MSRKLAVFSTSILLLSISGPGERQITDPHSIRSVANPKAGPVAVDDLFFSRNVSSPAWSPDGQEIVFTTNLTGRSNLWKVAASGGWPIQLAASDDRQSGAVWSPDGKSIVYQQDRGGGEIYDLFVIPSAGGQAVNLTNTDAISETGPSFSRDGKFLAISYKPKTSSTPDLAVLDWQTHQVKNLTNEKSKDRLWSFVAWSPDAKSMYANRLYVGGTDADVYRVNIATGALENLTSHQGQTVYAASSLSSDGRTLVIATNKSGFNNVALLDTSDKKITPVTDTEWEADPGSFAPAGDTFSYTLNQDGRTKIYLSQRGSNSPEQIEFPEGLSLLTGNPTPFSPGGDRLLVSHQSSRRPSDLWIFDLSSKHAVQLTFSAIASLDPANLPQSQLVHYKSFDGKIISAFVWMPFNLQPNGTAPGIVLPHGGPTGQTVDYFNREAAALASGGYVCIAPNVRGSTGYGLEFQKANKKDLGGGDLQDEVYASRFLIDTGFVDPKRMGITGGSYGGYMTLMAIGKTPDVWAAAVEEYGIINWMTMLQHEDPFLQEYEKSLLGDPVKDRKIYDEDSPIAYLRSAKAPLLVLQGDNDIRVPKEEAEQVVEILKKEGRTVDAHYYPNEGHGFSKRENQVDAMNRTIAWFDKYLKSEGAASGRLPSASQH
ncbi:MAG: S9 family peptidase [Acidobacteriota bacterium]|nr:S9 family peptidase [Acidobacteriota bacterium]